MFIHTDIKLLKMFVVFVRCSLAWVLWIYGRLMRRLTSAVQEDEDHTSPNLAKQASVNGCVSARLTSMPSRYSSANRATNPS